MFSLFLKIRRGVGGGILVLVIFVTFCVCSYHVFGNFTIYYPLHYIHGLLGDIMCHFKSRLLKEKRVYQF